MRAQPHEGGRLISVLVVEDHGAVRKGIELILRDAGFEVVGSAGDVESGRRLIARRCPDVALVDLNLPGADGSDLARDCMGLPSGPRVLLYTAVEDPVQLRRALSCGAAGIACKAGLPSELVAAVRTVAAGEDYLDPRLAALLAATAQVETVLSKREREVLKFLADGLTGEEIAGRLIVSPETVRTHIRNAMLKLGTRTRVHAITEAIRREEIRLGIE